MDESDFMCVFFNVKAKFLMQDSKNVILCVVQLYLVVCTVASATGSFAVTFHIIVDMQNTTTQQQFFLTAPVFSGSHLHCQKRKKEISHIQVMKSNIYRNREMECYSLPSSGTCMDILQCQ